MRAQGGCSWPREQHEPECGQEQLVGNARTACGQCQTQVRSLLFRGPSLWNGRLCPQESNPRHQKPDRGGILGRG